MISIDSDKTDREKNPTTFLDVMSHELPVTVIPLKKVLGWSFQSNFFLDSFDVRNVFKCEAPYTWFNSLQQTSPKNLPI